MQQRDIQGIVTDSDNVDRCFWCMGTTDYIAYHDNEWGRPVADDIYLFEKLCLEGYQTGLSWLTILRKRDNFRSAFLDFDFEKIARFDSSDVIRLLRDKGIVRHRGKIESTINNAKRMCDLVDEFGSLSNYVWCYEPDMNDRPEKITKGILSTLTQTPASGALSKDLKRRGWSFIGPTTAYAFMQAVGIVNDHIEGCRFRLLAEADRSTFKRPEG